MVADVRVMSAADEGKTPLITVVLPVFNGGEYLRLAVRSILEQSFDEWELLIIDDGSSDSAVDALRDGADGRIRFFQDRLNKGLAARLNEAIDLARGEFFARMDQDDVSHPERLSRQLRQLRADSSLDLVGTQCITISSRNEIIGTLPRAESHEEISARPWVGFYMPHPTWMGRTEWFRKNRYASPGPYCCEDQELLLRTHKTSRFYVLPERLLAYRLRERFSWNKNWRTRKTLYGIQTRFFAARMEYLNVLKATAMFLVRVGWDARVLLGQVLLGSAVHRKAKPFMQKAEIEIWKCLLRPKK